MTSQELKAFAEKMGYGIAHARSHPRLGEVRAYVATYRADAVREVTELRWSACNPAVVRLVSCRLEGTERDVGLLTTGGGALCAGCGYPPMDCGPLVDGSCADCIAEAAAP